MPMVVMKLGVNESSLNLRRQHDLPTPESPIKRSFICTMETHVSPFQAPDTESGWKEEGGGEGGRSGGGAHQEVIVPISGHYL